MMPPACVRPPAVSAVRCRPAPALAVLDRTTTGDDDEGRGVEQQLFFLIDADGYREARASGLAWLDEEPPSCHNDDRGNTCGNMQREPLGRPFGKWVRMQTD
jgi:hypothetical protein